MKSEQPEWQFVANLGDAHPIDHGGYFVYVDKTGVYAPEAEYLEAPENEPKNPNKIAWRAYRFVLEPCTYVDGILSDNPYHPSMPAWFAEPESRRVERPHDTGYLLDLAKSTGADEQELVDLFVSDNPMKRAEAWRRVGDYHGFANLDHYPLRLTKAQAEERYENELQAIRPSNARSEALKYLEYITDDALSWMKAADWVKAGPPESYSEMWLIGWITKGHGIVYVGVHYYLPSVTLDRLVAIELAMDGMIEAKEIEEGQEADFVIPPEVKHGDSN